LWLQHGLWVQQHINCQASAEQQHLIQTTAAFGKGHVHAQHTDHPLMHQLGIKLSVLTMLALGDGKRLALQLYQ